MSFLGRLKKKLNNFSYTILSEFQLFINNWNLILFFFEIKNWLNLDGRKKACITGSGRMLLNDTLLEKQFLQ